jgi:hypothetical protein
VAANSALPPTARGLLPHVPLQTCYWGDINKVDHPMSNDDPERTVATDSEAQLWLARSSFIFVDFRYLED